MEHLTCNSLRELHIYYVQLSNYVCQTGRIHLVVSKVANK